MSYVRPRASDHLFDCCIWHGLVRFVAFLDLLRQTLSVWGSIRRLQGRQHVFTPPGEKNVYVHTADMQPAHFHLPFRLFFWL